MLVQDCMMRHPVMLAPETSASEAQKVMAENHLRHAPVVGDGKRLAGFLTRSRLTIKADTLASLNVWEITLKVKDIMIAAEDTISTKPDYAVEWAAKTLAEHKIGGMPVLDQDGAVIGVLSEVDVLNAFQKMLGLPASGVRITVRMPNRHGEFTKLMNAVTGNGWGVMGIGTFPSPRKEGYYDAVLKIPDISAEDARAKLGAIEDQEILDIRVSE